MLKTHGISVETFHTHFFLDCPCDGVCTDYGMGTGGGGDALQTLVDGVVFTLEDDHEGEDFVTRTHTRSGENQPTTTPTLPPFLHTSLN